MRKTNNIRPVLDHLLTSREKMLMNILFQIDRIKSSAMYTDDEWFITGQDHPSHPLWIWKKEGAMPPSVHFSLCSIVKDALSSSAELEVNGDSSLLPVIEEAALSLGYEAKVKVECIGYAMLSIPPHTGKGSVKKADSSDTDDVANLISLMYEDSGASKPLSLDEAYDMASDKIKKGQIRLYIDRRGNAVSMARICYEGDEMARINTVVTMREDRGKGYARALVSSVCRELMARKKIPILFAVRDYEPSNACYQRAGFSPLGAITVWHFVSR